MNSPDISKLSFWLAPFLALVVLTSLIPFQIDVVAEAEMRFLAMLAGVVLAALAAWGGERRTLTHLLPTTLLIVAVAWVAPADPHRGALITLILVIALGLAMARTWFDSTGNWRHNAQLGLVYTLPLAIALQALIRCDLLLLPTLEPRNLARLALLPLVAAGSLSYLARFFASRRVLLVGAVAMFSTPGLNTTVTLALVALAAGAAISQEESRWVKAAAVAVLALLPFWQPPLGALLALVGVGLFWGARGTIPIMVLAFGLTMFFGEAKGRAEGLETWLVGVLLLVPAAFLAAPKDRANLRLGAVLALATALIVRSPEAMVGGLALMALAVPDRGPCAALQGLWTSILAIGTVLLSSFPWLRNDPQGDFLELLGLSDLSSIILPAALVIGLGAMFPLFDTLPGRLRPKPWVVVGLLLVFALWRGIKPSEVLLERYQTVVLGSQKHGTFFKEYPPRQVSAVVVESSLVHGVELVPGAPVARVKLRGPDREVLETWPIRAGYDTAEWAASRPDIQTLPSFMAPDPWISLLAPDGRFFANHFRVQLHLSKPVMSGSITIDREQDLPDPVQVLVYRLELRP